MTHSDYTRNILNIKDENIHFQENCLEVVKIKGVETKVFHGILTYNPPHSCPCCGCINDNDSIIKWGLKKNCTIKLDKVSNYNIIHINTNKVLKATYNYYQGILKSIDKKDKDLFLSIISNPSKDLSLYAKKANKTLNNMKSYIVNAFDYKYSNGIVEGTNNLIKQIKHAACGYRKFYHLKARIMLVKGLINPIKNA